MEATKVKPSKNGHITVHLDDQDLSMLHENIHHEQYRRWMKKIKKRYPKVKKDLEVANS